MMKMLVVALGLIGLSAPVLAQDTAPDDQEGSDHKVRFQTHFHKPLIDGGLGVGGWVVLPDVIGMSTSTLFLIGPRYEGDGWWVEGLAGGMMTAGDPVSHPWVLSGRFEFTPDALDAPIRVWGNLQLNDVMGGAFQPYTLLMVDYALMDGKILLGVETENYINMAVPSPNGEDSKKTINDFSVGPQLVLPFGGLSITSSLQFHPEETIRNQFWLRVMYDFGPVGS